MSQTKKITFMVTAALLILMFDITVVITVLPVMVTTFHADSSQFKLVIALYLLFIGIFLPLSYGLSQRVGDKKVFMSGLLCFMLGSLVCSLSFNLPLLLSGRVIQALGGASMIASGIQIMMRLHKHENLSKVSGRILFYGFFGSVLGPLVGGLIYIFLPWQMVFLINLPIGMLLLSGLSELSNYASNSQKFDGLGWLFMSIMVIALMMFFGEKDYVLEGGLSYLIIGFVALIGFLYQLRHHPNPIFDLSLFKNKYFLNALVISNLMRMVVGAFFFTSIMFLELGMKLLPIETGIVLCLFSVGAFMARGLMVKYGFYFAHAWQHVMCGCVLAFAFLVMSQVTFSIHLYEIGLSFMVQGFLVTLFLKQTNINVFTKVKKNQVFQAMKIYTISQFTIWSMGVVISGAVLAFIMNKLVVASSFTLPCFEYMYIFLSITLLMICGFIYYVETKKYN